ncbi:Uncharacterised protein [Mycolicibacterium vanbaalenii]|uniref:ChsH2 C-terminal OB-fold domain-containing protein n=1 Tax=Mycolicibacterium vanbaalenii TaxID=110539 RepID=A0A5S9MPK4_MYCVN|nr:OB-fold domain-containing protein [Mycolicibacterium vanbaalenii]CAA0078920.1 Uncharacterised protein [Mycolicibacterium vanbaalenii]
MTDGAAGWGRPGPALTELNRTYWTSGAEGLFRLQRCPECERLIHPPALRCQRDHASPEWATLSGRGVVESWTVNRHPFYPGFPDPYVIAFVNPIEDVRTRVLTNLVNIDPDDIAPGMPVRVRFESDDENVVFFPLFAPDDR